jgi:hypothetical protein
LSFVDKLLACGRGFCFEEVDHEAMEVLNGASGAVQLVIDVVGYFD